jgi:hypothetical protein
MDAPSPSGADVRAILRKLHPATLTALQEGTWSDGLERLTVAHHFSHADAVLVCRHLELYDVSNPAVQK